MEAGRTVTGEYLRFLLISLASLKETEYFFLLARHLGHLRQHEYDMLIDLTNGAFGVLQGSVKAVKNDIRLRGRLQAVLLSTLLITLGKLQQ